MKRLLALILSLLLCLGLLASCNEEEQSSSSSSSSSSEEQSSSQTNTPPAITDRTIIRETSNEITRYSISDPYTSYTGESYHRIKNFSADGFGACATVIANYEEFLSSPVYDIAFTVVNPFLFEENFIVLTNVCWQEGNDPAFYTDFQKDLTYYTLTVNSFDRFHSVMDQSAYKHTTDICVIPRSLCDEDVSQIEVRLIQKTYEFKGEVYNSECEITTILPE